MCKVKLIIADINDFIDYKKELKEECIPRYLKKYNELSFTNEKLQELVAGMLLRKFLCVNNDDDIYNDKNGKPFLRTINKFYSISHSEDFVIIAISDVRVGLDIEKVRKYHKQVADRYFDSNIKKKLDNLEGLDKDQAFTSYWTKLESLLKLDGQGFSKDITEIDSETITLTEKYGDYYLSCSIYGREKIKFDKLFIRHFSEICSSEN